MTDEGATKKEVPKKGKKIQKGAKKSKISESQKLLS